MSVKKGADFLKAIAERVANAKGFNSTINTLRVTSGGEGKCMAELKIGVEHINLHGGVHGGVLAMLINNVTNYALMSKTALDPGAAIDMQIMFLKAAKLGDELVVDADTNRTDGKWAYIECEIRNKKDGSIIAKGAQTKYVDFV